jgi:hypothetical protein
MRKGAKALLFPKAEGNGLGALSTAPKNPLGFEGITAKSV